MKDGELQLVAASLSFSTALAIIPFFAVVLAALQHFGSLDVLYPKVETLLLTNFKGSIGTEGINVFKKIIERIHDGKTGSVGALILILTSTRLIFDMEHGIHRVWHIKTRRSLFRRLFIYWLLLLALPFALATYVAFINIKTVEPIIHLFPTEIRAGAITFILLYLIYKYVPDIKVKWFPAAISAAVATCLLGILQIFFKTLTREVFNYSKVYGSIAAIPAFLIWTLFVWQIILFGVALNASLQKKRQP